jgi:hypothetical protein
MNWPWAAGTPRARHVDDISGGFDLMSEGLSLAGMRRVPW